MFHHVLIRSAAALVAFAFGFAWAAAAAAVGIAGGLVFAATVAGVFALLLRTMLQPGASEEDRAQRLVPPWLTTFWIGGLAVACVYVASETHAGAYEGALGVDFLPAVVPFALLTLTGARLLGLGFGNPSASDFTPDLDL